MLKKAFDQLEWVYLIDTRNRFGSGCSFSLSGPVLCRSPNARVLVNGSEFDIFPLSRCPCQGCRLSPLLFAPALKPLAEAISAHQGLSGVKLGDGENRLSLYADDVLMFVTNTENSISALISIMGQLGLILGYTINVRGWC